MVVWICVCFVGYCVLVDYGGVGLGCRARLVLFCCALFVFDWLFVGFGL